MINESSLDKVFNLMQDKQNGNKIIDNIAEISNLIICQIDKNLLVKYISPNLEKILKINPDILINSNIVNFQYPDVSNFMIKTIKQINNNPDSIKLYKSDFYLSENQNNEMWFRIFIKPYTKNNKFDQMIGMSYDVTINKKSERLESEKKALYENMFQTSQSIIFIMNPDTLEILDYNNEAKKYFQFENNKINILFSDYSPEFNMLFKKNRHLFETSNNLQLIIDIKTKNKTYQTAKLSLSKLKLPDNFYYPSLVNSPYLIQTIVVDITDKTITELELNKQINKYYTFFNSSPIILWEVDLSLLRVYINSLSIPDNINLYDYLQEHKEILTTSIKLLILNTVNKLTMTIFKFKNIQEIRNHFNKITREETFNLFGKMICSLYYNQESFEDEGILYDKDNKPVRLIVKWNLIKEGKYFPLKAIVSMINISERYEYFEKLIEQSQEINKINEELKNALEKEQQLTLEANISNEIKNKFLATMSHEFRTPLNGILGMTQLLMKTNLNEDQKQLLNILDDSSNNLLTLVNDIFDFVKLDSSNVAIIENNFSLYDLCQSAIQSFSNEAFKKDLDIYLDWSFDYPDFVSGDNSRLRQALNNLIDNAVKFTSYGTIILSLESANQIQKDQYLYNFSIINTGNKINKENKKNLFKIFSQLDNSLERKNSGTGLGLALVKQIFKLLNGNIEYIDNDECTRFNFSLPLKSTSPHFQKLPEIKTVKKINILFIDNEHNIYQNIFKFFTDLNINFEIITILRFIAQFKHIDPDIKYDYIICDAINFIENPESNYVLLKILSNIQANFILLYRHKDLLDTKNIKHIDKLYKPLNIIELKNLLAKKISSK